MNLCMLYTHSTRLIYVFFIFPFSCALLIDYRSITWYRGGYNLSSSGYICLQYYYRTIHHNVFKENLVIQYLQNPEYAKSSKCYLETKHIPSYTPHYFFSETLCQKLQTLTATFTPNRTGSTDSLTCR